MNRGRISPQKSDRLSSLRENSEEDFDFEGEGIPTLKPSQSDDLFGLEEEFGTLRLSPHEKIGRKPSNKLLSRKASLSPGFMMKFVETQEDHLSYDQDFGEPDAFLPNDVLKPARQETMPPAKFSPGTMSNHSPSRRRSLSDYSEDTDTAMTSELDDDGFEDEIDDIFGKEESGIYSSGGRSNAANVSRAGQVLSTKRQQLQRQAEREEAELYERYKQQRQKGAATSTLKLKDLNQASLSSRINQDALENERTVNYEYTRDDYEAFEDGFDLNEPLDLEISKFHQSAKKKNLAREMSMPNFPKSLEPSKPTKFKSSMDLVALTRKDHPVFNSSNDIIKKLNRMPSFHNQPRNVEPKNDDEINRDMEKRKKELLEKYMEITEKQKKLNTSPRKARKQFESDVRKKGVGLVKFLNQHTKVPAVSPNNNMKFNPTSRLWEGNEHDLMRFDETEGDNLVKKPGLIRKQDFRSKNEKIQGNMRYDAENLRWVSTDDNDKENEKIFHDLPDLEPNDMPRPDFQAMSGRGVSTFTQRTISTTSSDRSSSVGRYTEGDEFRLSAKIFNRFEKEEAKMKRKTHNWFAPKEQYRLHRHRQFNAEYFWEIRKMVCEGE